MLGTTVLAITNSMVHHRVLGTWTMLPVPILTGGMVLRSAVLANDGTPTLLAYDAAQTVCDFRPRTLRWC